MLFKHPTLPLDLRAVKESNFVPNELHTIVDDPSTIFALSKGPFYINDLRVVNDVTGADLMINQDYKPIQIYLGATKETGRAVYCCIQILNRNVTRVKVTYRAVGGKFQSMLPVILEMRDQIDPGFVPTIPYSKLINVPAQFKPADHRHAFSDIVGLEVVFNAIYNLLNNLMISQKGQYTDIFAYAQGAFVSKAVALSDQLNDLDAKAAQYEVASRYGHLDIKITDNPQVPSNYLKYGQVWTKIEGALIYGAGVGDTIGTMVGLADGSVGSGLNARTTYLWQLHDNVEDMLFSVTANKSSVNEGSSVTFTVTSTGRITGTAVQYIITGVQANDIEGGELADTIFLNASGVASRTVTLVADGLTEGTENIRFTIVGFRNRFVQIPVNDTSTNPYLEAYYAMDELGEHLVTVVQEGTRIYLIVKAQNIPNNSTYYLTYDGSTAGTQDFLAALPDTVLIRDGFAAIPFDIKNDKTTEGNENLVISIGQSADHAQAMVAARIRIMDSSIEPAFSMRLSSDIDGNAEVSNVNEGASFYLHVFTTNLEDGTELNLAYDGTYTAGDFDSGLPTTITVVNNYSRIKYDVRADLKSEGTEVMNIRLMYNGQATRSTTISINDVSNNPDARASFSSNRFGTNEIIESNEGDSVYLILQVNGFPDGTILPLRYRGATPADFSDAWPTGLTITNGVAYQLYRIFADMKTEGDKYWTVSVMNEDNTAELCSAQLLIHDTSRQPEYNIKFTSDQLGNNEVASVNEGDKVYVQVYTEYLGGINVLGVDVFIGNKRATIANGDVNIVPPNTVTVVNGRGVFSITPSLDQTTEGDEEMVVRIRSDQSSSSPVVKTASITVNDTSTDPTWSAHFSSLADGSDDITGNMVMEGQTIYLVFDSTNIAPGTTFWLDYLGSGGNQATEADFVNALPGFLTVQADREIIPLQIKADFAADYITGSYERLTANFYTDVNLTQKILTATVDIVDPTFQMKFSPNLNGSGSTTQANEGDRVYLWVNTANVPNGTAMKLRYLIESTVVSGDIPDIIETLVENITITNNAFSLPLSIRTDNIPDGQKRLQVQLFGPNYQSGDTPLAIANLNMIDTSFGGVTALGTYRPGDLGTISIPALGTRLITIVGGGGMGAPGAVDDPVSPVAEGTDGVATTIRYGGNTLFTAGAGRAGYRNDPSNSGGGGTTVINTAAIGNISNFTVTDIVTTNGLHAPLDSAQGAASVAINTTGAGSNGLVTGSGGGSAALVQFRITNTVNAMLALGVTVGTGGLVEKGLPAQIWNNGCLIIEA